MCYDVGMTSTTRQTGFGLLALVVVVAVVIAAYFGIWWLRRDVTDREARVQQQTYGRQNALVEQILDDVEEALDPDIPANQRAALTDIICDSAAKLTGSIQLPNFAQNFISEECP